MSKEIRMGNFGCDNVVWDLSDLFKSEQDEAITLVTNDVLEKAASFEQTYKSRLHSLAATELKQAYEAYEMLLTPLYKLGQYASLRNAIDTQNETIKKLVSKIDDVESTVANHLVFFDLELSKFDASYMDTLVKDATLRNYAYSLFRSHQTAQYNLNEAEEKIINLKDVTGSQGYKKLYSELTASFSFTMELDGKKQVLTGPEMRNLRLHHDQAVRKEAMELFFDAYKQNEITITHIFNSILKDFNTERKLRGYKLPIHVRNISNDLSDQTIDLLHNVTTQSNKLVQRYYRLKKELLGLNEMTLSDIYAPFPNVNDVFSYSDAKKLVLDGFYEFDSEFGDIAKAMFDRNRIHAPVVKHKRGGAFCSGSTPDCYPYVMLNFLGKPRDVSTMAHELGHAIHDVLASKQTLTNYHPILPLAETASVFSEMLVTDILKKRLTDKQSKIVMLSEKLEDIFATSHRQNMFSEFEKASHLKVSDTLLSSQELCDIYNQHLKSMFGDSVAITAEYQWEWATIPHFLDYPFYVYAYNFGNLLVFALYQLYLEEGASFVPQLKTLLAAGSSASPLDITRSIGVDIESEAFWQKSIVYIEEMVNELETLVRS
ncbi:peptidase M3 [bacterium]|nr:peptidase M3 [bacterium]